MAASEIEIDALAAGDDIATDLISLKHYQIVKLTYGALDSQTIASSGAGAVDAGVARYTLASDDPAVALLGTIDTDTGTISTNSGTIAGDTTSIDGKITACDTTGLLTTTAHDAAFGTAGTADAQVRSVQGIAGGTALPVSGTVTANPASGTIDTVTTVSTVTNLSQLGGTAVSMNTGVRDAGTQRVTIATNDSVPVTGTITANLSTTDNTVLDNIQTAVELIDNAISGTEMQVDVVAALPAGTNAIGKLAANSGVDIGDVDVTSLPGSATSAATAFDSYTHASINLTTGANQVLVSSAASKQIWVYGIGFSCSADGTGVSFQDELDVAVTGIMTFAQYGGMAVNPAGNFEMPLWKLGTDKDLEVDVTTGDIDGWICYAIVSV